MTKRKLKISPGGNRVARQSENYEIWGRKSSWGERFYGDDLIDKDKLTNHKKEKKEKIKQKKLEEIKSAKIKEDGEMLKRIKRDRELRGMLAEDKEIKKSKFEKKELVQILWLVLLPIVICGLIWLLYSQYVNFTTEVI